MISVPTTSLEELGTLYTIRLIDFQFATLQIQSASESGSQTIVSADSLLFMVTKQGHIHQLVSNR